MDAESERSAKRALVRYPRSAGFRRAYLKGWTARTGGLPADACPYRRRSGWAWRRAWLAGYADAGER